MKKLIVATAVFSLLGSPAWAGGDKVAEAFVDPSSLDGGLNGFSNGSSAGKVASKGCQIAVQVKGISTSALPDGQVAICLLDADIFTDALPGGPFGNTLVVQAQAKGGSLKTKSKLEPIGCGAGKTVTFNGGAECYLPDDAYRIGWEQICTDAGMTPLPYTDAKCANPLDDPKKCNTLGVCQGFVADGGQRIPRPSSGLIAQQGSTIQ
jgi:hypothetical protein